MNEVKTDVNDRTIKASDLFRKVKGSYIGSIAMVVSVDSNWAVVDLKDGETFHSYGSYSDFEEYMRDSFVPHFNPVTITPVNK